MIAKDKCPMLTVLHGFVGRDEVTAFIYPGKDSDLSHYSYKGKTYMGSVKFTSISSTETKKY